MITQFELPEIVDIDLIDGKNNPSYNHYCLPGPIFGTSSSKSGGVFTNYDDPDVLSEDIYSHSMQESIYNEYRIRVLERYPFNRLEIINSIKICNSLDELKNDLSNLVEIFHEQSLDRIKRRDTDNKPQLNGQLRDVAARLGLEIEDILSKRVANVEEDCAGNNLLHVASIVGNLKLIEEIFDKAPHYFCPNKKSFTPLHLIIQHEHKDLVVRALSFIDPNNLWDDEAFLKTVAQCNNADIIKLCLDHICYGFHGEPSINNDFDDKMKGKEKEKIDDKATSSEGNNFNPLLFYYAIKYGNDNVFKIIDEKFIKYSINSNHSNINASKLFGMALQLYKNDTGLIKLDKTNREYILSYLCRLNENIISQEILQDLINIDNIQGIKYLAKEIELNYEIDDLDRNIKYMCEHNKFNCFNYFLEDYINTNIEKEEGEQEKMLMNYAIIAIKHDSFDVLRLLTQHELLNKNMDVLITEMFQNYSAKCLLAVISEFADFESLDKENGMNLYLKAAKENKPNLLHLLAYLTEDVNLQNTENMTAADLIAQNRNINSKQAQQLFDILKEYKFDFDLVNYERLTLLSSVSRMKVVTALLRSTNFSVDKCKNLIENYPKLTEGVNQYLGHIYIWNLTNNNYLNTGNNNILHTIILNGSHPSTGKNLSQYIEEDMNTKTELNKENINGNTPLHLAVYFQDHDAVKTLLNSDVYVDIENKFYVTPFEIALLKRDEESIELFFNYYAGRDEDKKEKLLASMKKVGFERIDKELCEKIMKNYYTSEIHEDEIEHNNKYHI